jgi:hypothetical protein
MYSLVLTKHNNSCESEMSLENLLLWNDIEVVSNQLTCTPVLDHIGIVNRIKEEYIMSGSPYEVNLSSKAKKNVMECKECNNRDTVETLLGQLKGDIIINLSDTYSRYTSSPLFKYYRMANAMHHKLEYSLNK